jgi:hypothetical protein
MSPLQHSERCRNEEAFSQGHCLVTSAPLACPTLVVVSTVVTRNLAAASKLQLNVAVPQQAVCVCLWPLHAQLAPEKGYSETGSPSMVWWLLTHVFVIPPVGAKSSGLPSSPPTPPRLDSIFDLVSSGLPSRAYVRGSSILEPRN